MYVLWWPSRWGLLLVVAVAVVVGVFAVASVVFVHVAIVPDPLIRSLGKYWRGATPYKISSTLTPTQPHPGLSPAFSVSLTLPMPNTLEKVHITARLRPLNRSPLNTTRATLSPYLAPPRPPHD